MHVGFCGFLIFFLFSYWTYSPRSTLLAWLAMWTLLCSYALWMWTWLLALHWDRRCTITSPAPSFCCIWDGMWLIASWTCDFAWHYLSCLCDGRWLTHSWMHAFMQGYLFTDGRQDKFHLLLYMLIHCLSTFQATHVLTTRFDIIPSQWIEGGLTVSIQMCHVQLINHYRP